MLPRGKPPEITQPAVHISERKYIFWWHSLELSTLRILIQSEDLTRVFVATRSHTFRNWLEWKWSLFISAKHKFIRGSVPIKGAPATKVMHNIVPWNLYWEPDRRHSLLEYKNEHMWSYQWKLSNSLRTFIIYIYQWPIYLLTLGHSIFRYYCKN